MIGSRLMRDVVSHFIGWIKMVKMTKTAITIATMNANADKPMAVVVKLIAEANSVTEAVARGAYRWCVNKGVAHGVLEVKAPKRDKLVEAAKREGRKYAAKKKATVKLSKATVKLSTIVAATNKAFTAKANKSMLDSLAAEKAAGAPAKDPDAVARIKAANLARMKEVTSKRKTYTNVARPEGPGVEDFDAALAKKMVAEYNAGNDEALNETPRFLTKSELAVIL
jgi:hypothetical protein